MQKQSLIPLENVEMKVEHCLSVLCVAGILKKKKKKLFYARLVASGPGY